METCSLLPLELVNVDSSKCSPSVDLRLLHLGGDLPHVQDMTSIEFKQLASVVAEKGVILSSSMI